MMCSKRIGSLRTHYRTNYHAYVNIFLVNIRINKCILIYYKVDA